MPRPRRSILEILFAELRSFVLGLIFAAIAAVAIYLVWLSQIPRITEALVSPLKGKEQPKQK